MKHFPLCLSKYRCQDAPFLYKISMRRPYRPRKYWQRRPSDDIHSVTAVDLDFLDVVRILRINQGGACCLNFIECEWMSFLIHVCCCRVVIVVFKGIQKYPAGRRRGRRVPSGMSNSGFRASSGRNDPMGKRRKLFVQAVKHIHYPGPESGYRKK